MYCISPSDTDSIYMCCYGLRDPMKHRWKIQYRVQCDCREKKLHLTSIPGGICKPIVLDKLICVHAEIMTIAFLFWGLSSLERQAFTVIPSPSLCVLPVAVWVSTGAPVSSNRPKTCRLGWWVALNCPEAWMGCLSLCVSPVLTWRPVQDVPDLSHNVGYDQFHIRTAL